MNMRTVVSMRLFKLACLVFSCMVLSGQFSMAQQSVSIGTTTIKNNAVLNLVSQGKNQGLIIPIVSNRTAVTHDTGMLIYDESDNKLYYRSNSAWVEVSGSGGAITLGGDLSGTPATASVAKLQGKTISAANPTDGQILKYNATTSTWTLSADGGAAYTQGTGISIVANQISIANDGVTTTQIAPNTITDADLNKTTIPLSGFGAAAATVDLGTQRVINLGTPTTTTDATTKAYVDGADATKLNASVLTTNGDLLFHNGTIVTRLPRGTNAQILQSTATGIQWTTSTAFTNPLTTTGDIIFGGASGTPTRLAGAAGFLKSTGAVAPTWSAVNLASTDVSGIVPIANGGTNASTAATARTNLGLGTLAVLGSVGSAEITDLSIVNNDVSATAGILGTKINPDFGGQTILTQGRVGIGTASPTYSLDVQSALGTTQPLVNVQQTGGTGDASQLFTTPVQSYSVGTTSTGSFKISNSTSLGVNDHYEITSGSTDVTGYAKVLMDLGPRGQDGLQIHSSATWGTSLHLSNGTDTGTGQGYSLAVTGTAGPTSQAGDFAMVKGLSQVFTIGYNSAGPYYATNFPEYDNLLGGTTPMRMGINLASTAMPAYNLELIGSAAKNSGTTWINTSDLRLKKDVSQFTDGLNIITKINPIWFRYNGRGGTVDNGKLQVGVAAQEMKDIAPYTVGTFKAKFDDTSPPQEFYNFDYNAIGYALINAVKELDSKVKDLEKENALLKEQLQNDSIQAPMNDASQLRTELENQKARTTQLESELKEIRRLIGVEAKKN